jgi:hypothetical protein
VAGSTPPAPPPPPPTAPGGGFGPPPGSFGPPPPPFGPGGAPQDGGALSSPFADRAKLGFLRAFVQTWKLAAIEPALFFRRVRTDELKPAVLFGVLSWTVGAMASTVWAILTATATRTQLSEIAERIRPQSEAGARFFGELAIKAADTATIVRQAIFSPISGLIILFVAAGLFHLLLLLVRGANRGFGATLTVVGYAMGLSLLQLIPQCGFPVAVVWAAVVTIIGLAEAHRSGVGKGAAAVLLPVALLCVCACGALILAIGAVGALSGAGGLPKSF